MAPLFHLTMPTRSKKPVCVACNDTGVSSSGKPCRPCELNGLIKPKLNLPDSARRDNRPALPKPKKPSLWE